MPTFEVDLRAWHSGDNIQSLLLVLRKRSLLASVQFPVHSFLCTWPATLRTLRNRFFVTVPGTLLSTSACGVAYL
jgi:hypothetical protein